jgi:hypothetical protein
VPLYKNQHIESRLEVAVILGEHRYVLLDVSLINLENMAALSMQSQQIIERGKATLRSLSKSRRSVRPAQRKTKPKRRHSTKSITVAARAVGKFGS